MDRNEVRWKVQHDYMMQEVCQEVFKALKGKRITQYDIGSVTNFAGTIPPPFHAVTKAVTLASPSGIHGWIIDIVASDHMSPHMHLLIS